MASRDPDRPNILFILSDDQGHWAMGCAGNEEIRTPALDRLARTGIRFEHFFCTSPVCSPARASLLTGRIPSQHGIQDFLRAGNVPGEPEGRGPIEYLAGQWAYTDLLAQRGYDCALSGKWHLGDSARPQKSFRFWDVHASGSGPYYYAPMIRDGKPYRDPRYVSDLITDNALVYLEGQLADQAPFCLNVHYTAPHAPWMRQEHPAELYDDYYQNCPFRSIPDEPMHPHQLYKEEQMGTTPEMRRKVLSGYFAAVTGMDRNIGRLLDWLEEYKLRENTLIFFTSDNGMSMGHHGIYGKGNGTFPPNMFDTAVKVPTLVSRPGHVPQGLVCEALLSHYDWVPTLLDYLGLDIPDAEHLPGHSFAPLLRGEPFQEKDWIVVYDEYGPTRMVRNREWKYVHRYPYGPHELYHLSQDPDEKVNLVDDPAHRGVREALRAELEAWFVRYVDPARDGTHEAVMGRGQIDIVGPA
ncbi:MAG: sulfatase-like hydrolase/transferase, partial [Chloroflexi bacterium]|nr:sulfatase-like hydrolase/transferase [Chloroflexota bacterium]